MNPIISDLIWNPELSGFGTAQNFAYILNQVNSIVTLIDPSGNVTLAKSYVDASLAARDLAISTLNASTGAALGAFATNASVGTALAKDLRIYQGTFAGIKDASGTNGDTLLQDASIYIKLSGTWHSFATSPITFG
jgi:hypothetical protein